MCSKIRRNSLLRRKEKSVRKTTTHNTNSNTIHLPFLREPHLLIALSKQLFFKRQRRKPKKIRRNRNRARPHGNRNHVLERELLTIFHESVHMDLIIVIVVLVGIIIIVVLVIFVAAVTVTVAVFVRVVVI